MGIAAPSNASGQTFSYTVLDHSYKETRTRDGHINWQFEGSQGAVYKWQQKSPTVHPGYKLLPGGGKWKLPSSYGRHLAEFDYVPEHTKTHVWWVNDPFDAEWEGNVLDSNPVDWSPPWISPYEGIIKSDGHSEAIVKALNDLGDKKVDLATYVAESMKSAEMLADAAISFGRLLLNAKRGRLGIKSLRDTIYDANGLHLQWRYGWRPLAMELYSMYDICKNGLGQKPIILSATGKSSNSFSGTYSVRGREGKYNCKVIDKCELWGIMKDETIYNAQQVGLVNPLVLGWELVPYSFVVDWFMPIGDFLSALTATAGLDFVAGYSSQIREGTFEVPIEVGRVKAKYKIFSREAYGGFPVAGVHFRPYAKKQPFNTTKVGILSSLLLQLTR